MMLALLLAMQAAPTAAASPGEIVAAAKPGGYPSFFCQGISSEPIAEASATAEPLMPPKMVEDTTPT